MTDVQGIETAICDELAAITGRDREMFSKRTVLIGSTAEIKSRQLVELLLAVEDFAADRLGKTFDWTSDSAMSEARSIFRTVETLAARVASLPKAA
jgi:hypothetical protein